MKTETKIISFLIVFISIGLSTIIGIMSASKNHPLPIYTSLILVTLLMLPFYFLHKYSKNVSLKKKPTFMKRYRICAICVPICFIVGVILISYLKNNFLAKSDLTDAIGIFLYGSLWVMAIYSFIIGFYRIPSRLKIPGLLAASDPKDRSIWLR